MNWFEALVLGLVQGLTEYLPVSSSGHLAIGAYLLALTERITLLYHHGSCSNRVEYTGHSVERN